MIEKIITHPFTILSLLFSLFLYIIIDIGMDEQLKTKNLENFALYLVLEEKSSMIINETIRCLRLSSKKPEDLNLQFLSSHKDEIINVCISNKLAFLKDNNEYQYQVLRPMFESNGGVVDLNKTELEMF